MNTWMIGTLVLLGSVATNAHDKLSATSGLVADNYLTEVTGKEDRLNADSIRVPRVTDFEINGKGSNSVWESADWHNLVQLDPEGVDYAGRFKVMYSMSGIYVLFEGQDSLISTDYDQDFGQLWNGDVFEVFFHPDVQKRFYFEYEINQLNKEIVLVIDRTTASSGSSHAKNYEGNRRVKKAVTVRGGEAEKRAHIQSWSAEIFFPFDLLQDLPNSPPVSGTVWGANFCRIDYDTGNKVRWSWSPKIKNTFHELENFRKIVFE